MRGGLKGAETTTTTTTATNREKMEKNPQESPRIQSNRVEEWKDRWERIRMKGGRKMEGEEEEEREEGEEGGGGGSGSTNEESGARAVAPHRNSGGAGDR